MSHDLQCYIMITISDIVEAHCYFVDITISVRKSIGGKMCVHVAEVYVAQLRKLALIICIPRPSSSVALHVVLYTCGSGVGLLPSLA